MWLKLNLEGTDFYLRISDYHPSDKDKWDDQWCKVEITLESYKWLHYEISSAILLSVEVEDIRDVIGDLLEDKLNEKKELEFIEPDLSFVMCPKEDLRNNPNFIYIAAGHEIVDVSAEMHIHLWNDGLTGNYLAFALGRDDLEQIRLYLQVLTHQLPTSDEKVQAQMGKTLFLNY